MLSEDQKKTIIRGIPEDFVVSGKNFHTQKVYANQYECEDFPAIILQYITQDLPLNRVLGNVLKRTKQFVDTIRYHSASETTEIESDFNNCSELYATDDPSNWPAVWNKANADSKQDNPIAANVGIHRIPIFTPSDEIWRLSWVFDTRFIPNNVKVLAANFRVWIDKFPDSSGNKLIIQADIPDYDRPSIPPALSDYNRTLYTSTADEFDPTSQTPSNWFNITISDLGSILKTKRSRWMLRTQKDVNGDTPVDNFEDYYYLFLNNPTYEPKLQLQLAYPLGQTHVMSIQEVKGIVGGNEYTFDPSEYQLVDESPTGFYNAIEFLGPTYPDDNTDVEVTYTAAWVRTQLANMKFDTLRISVYAEDDRDNKLFINGIIIVSHIANLVHQYFEYTFEEDDIVPIEVTEVRDTDFELEGETRRRRNFDVHLAYWETVEATKVESIEEVDKVPVTPQS